MEHATAVEYVVIEPDYSGQRLCMYGERHEWTPTVEKRRNYATTSPLPCAGERVFRCIHCGWHIDVTPKKYAPPSGPGRVTKRELAHMANHPCSIALFPDAFVAIQSGEGAGRMAKIGKQCSYLSIALRRIDAPRRRPRQ